MGESPTPDGSPVAVIDPAYSPAGGAVVLAAAVVQPDSVGSLKLSNSDPKAPPVIDYNFLSDPRDRRRMLEVVKLSRAYDSIFASVIDSEMMPGAGVQDDELLLKAIDEQLASYLHRPQRFRWVAWWPNTSIETPSARNRGPR